MLRLHELKVPSFFMFVNVFSRDTHRLDIFNTIKLIDLVTEKRGAETIEKNNQMYIHGYFKLSVLLINKCPFFCFRTSLLT